MTDNLTDLKAQWEQNKAQWEQLCKEQENLPREGFAQVFKVLDGLEDTFTPQHPYTENIALIDEAFCKAFKRNNQIMIDGNRLMIENALLSLQIENAKRPQEQTQPEGWRFYPISIFAPQQFHGVVEEEIEREAQQGEGFFENTTVIAELPDEALDEYLGVEVYNVVGNFYPYLTELRRYHVTGVTLGNEFTHNLFQSLKMIADYIKSNTNRPEAVKSYILEIVKEFDNIPVWGLIFQILTLQGLLSLLENCALKEGDNGYNEAQDLYEWTTELLVQKLGRFILTGAMYGDKDKERLQPLCDYLYNTEIGRALQDCIFKDERGNEESAITEGVRLPGELDTERARKYFARAVEVGYMTPNATNGQWLCSTARLGYFCSRVFDAPRPIAALEKYFGVTKLSASITQAGYEAKRADVKKWRAYIESKIFYD